MLTGIYNAAAGIDSAMKRFEIAAGNLAMQHIPGYLRRTIANENLDTTLPPTDNNSLTPPLARRDVESRDFRPGEIVTTDNPLDVALQGDGFFVVSGPNGPLYTRGGRFHLDEQGRLVTSAGMPVQGPGGSELTIPPTASLHRLKIATDGTLTVDANTIGKLEVVNFQSPDRLINEGASLLSAPADEPPTPATTRVVQGMYEQSNVSPVEELIQLIACQRQLDLSQKILKEISRNLEQRINAA